MDKNNLLEQVKTLYLKLDKDVLEKLILEWNDINDSIKHLKKINIDGVSPMTRIAEKPIMSLREDIPKITFNKKLFLKNCPKIKNDYVLLNKLEENE